MFEWSGSGRGGYVKVDLLPCYATLVPRRLWGGDPLFLMNFGVVVDEIDCEGGQK